MAGSQGWACAGLSLLRRGLCAEPCAQAAGTLLCERLCVWLWGGTGLGGPSFTASEGGVAWASLWCF